MSIIEGMIQTTMQAAALDRFGGVEAIALHTVPVPKVGPEDVLIRVESAGVGVWDAEEREGKYAWMFGTEPVFPYVLGWDGAGTVAAVGTQVSRFKLGDRVYAASIPKLRGGFYAELAVVHADHVGSIPAGLSMEQASVMPWDALTALAGLDDTLGLMAGETVMIFGASGGIGHLAVILAKRMGARVLAVASGVDGVALVQRLGADAAINGRTNDVFAAARAFAPDGLDAALLTAGGDVANRALDAVRDGGRVAYPNGVTPKPVARSGLHLVNYDARRDPAATAKLHQLIDAGPFEVHVAGSYPLARAADAHRALSTHFLGKLALRVG